MNKKFLSALAIVTVLVCALALTAFAADKTVYVKTGGTGDGSTEATAIGYISQAVAALGGEGGTVVICGDTTVAGRFTVPEQSGDLTFTAINGAKIKLSNRIQHEKNTNNNVITWDVPIDISSTSTQYFFGGFNNIVLTKNFVVTQSGGGSLCFFGGVHSSEADAVTNENCIADSAYSITVNNGTFARFGGGNVRTGQSDFLGAIAAPITITINGGTFGEVGTYSLESNNKNYNTFSISGMSILADDATLTINGGTFNSPIYAQGRNGTLTSVASEISSVTASDKKYYAIDGDIDINITGGTFNGGAVSAYYTQAAYTQVMRGDFNVNVTGGTFASDTVFDATQVKAYKDSDKKATLTYSNVENITPVRFDVVNNEEKTYDEPLRVAFIGDSITEGYTYTGEVVRLTDSYPARFLAYAEADENIKEEVIVSNFGIGASGVLPSTSRDYFKMLAWPIVSEETDANYVFIALGTNDANASGGTNGALELFEEKYTYLIETMGNLPDTEKVFITNAIYRNTSNAASDIRASAVIHPIQERVANALAEKYNGKYIFVDLYGLTYEAAVDDSLFKSPNGTIYEHLHPYNNGLDLMGKSCYNAAFNGVTKPTTDYKMTDIYISDDGTTFGTGADADNAISFIPVAFDKIALDSEVTIHVVGTFTFGGNFYVPLTASKVTIVGEGNDAKLVVGGNTFKIGTDTVIENITLSNSVSSGVHIMSCFNDVTITDTVKTEGSWSFYAGYNVFSLVEPTTATFDTVKSASSDNDCTFVVNGGTYDYFMLGNRRFTSNAPVGTYSGTMTATVGTGVTVGNNSAAYYGINGHNYLTGTINATLNGWGDLEVKEFPAHGSLSGITYNPRNNTGKINITLAESMTNALTVACDFDGDNKIGIADGLLALRYCLGSFDTAKSANYYGEKVENIYDALFIFKKIVK